MTALSLNAQLALAILETVAGNLESTNQRAVDDGAEVGGRMAKAALQTELTQLTAEPAPAAAREGMGER